MGTESWAVVAAFAAAILSFINVIATARLTARSENQKWVRDAAQPHVVNTLKISYALRINLSLTAKRLREFDGSYRDDSTKSIEERRLHAASYATSLHEFKDSILENLAEVQSQVDAMQDFIIELEFLADMYLMGRLEGLFDLHNLFVQQIVKAVPNIGTEPSALGPPEREKRLVKKIKKHEEKLRRAAHRQYGSEAATVRLSSWARSKCTGIVREYNKRALRD